MSGNLDPVATLLLERTMPYLKTLAEPIRVGTHQNSAYALKLLDEFARATHDQEPHAAVAERARKFYAADYGCAPNVEVSARTSSRPACSRLRSWATS